MPAPAWVCPACGADCPPGSVLCGLCWKRCGPTHRRAVNDAWRATKAAGFGDAEAAAAYDAVVAAAARAAAP